ncbi:hypothetical protein HBH56_032920 [Parastagonospora nodorum]|uniref:Uncharacterized protein n=2 Tax=Phaeosphaeria nodorum (strain SN15 / ATCC MYA-4574 / FGSC 10173) TaxID=321614 RepID=A0A7U2I574_PHANO|nr:hypothetical protein SNOG_07154 [Parastagonospora nodorum SN15]KAH3918186.1 hypothetical protein HBH56_032920 [Parastagonospora nodorum]EAT85805.1 hypothetical protein SNOG_07154 [Parastagonospora nodorum SN15]KAH3933576.1 hypothetical protein HBH54_066510 [Parastagonospora nodorum]KAH3952530.1 hypothetical protein HBH53_043520 [Parastagonospora nodorum]KAH3979853.1 hypothetical protein HBH51_054550 [Parastagonospora nodorum]
MNFLSSALRPQGREHVNDPEKDGAVGRTPMVNCATILEPAAMQQLDTFRHMVGIHSAKGHTENAHNHLHFDGRAAPNVGIYNRVCHREGQAKRGFELATLFINGCLGLQVIVAAALTAMDAEALVREEVIYDLILCTVARGHLVLRPLPRLTV